MKFEADTLRDVLANMRCPDCNMVGATAAIESTGPHFARASCAYCTRHLDWIGWPESPERPARRRTATRARALLLQGDPFCELCLRTEADLPAGEQLQVHHVDEDADNDEPANHRVYCTGCHQLLHWLRIYFGHQAALF